MDQLVYTPIGKFEHEGQKYVLIARSLSGMKSRMYAVYRVTNADGMLNADKTPVSATEKTVIDLPELPAVIEKFKVERPRSAIDLHPMMMNYIVAERPDLKLSSYLYIGFGEFEDLPKVFSAAFLDRMYMRVLHQSNNNIPKSIEEILKTRSLCLIIKAAQEFNNGMAEKILAHLKEKNYGYDVPGYMTHSEDAKEFRKAFDPKRQILLRHRLNVKSMAGKEVIVATYSLGNTSVSLLDMFSATITRIFPLEEAAGWKTVNEIGLDDKDPYYPVIQEILKVRPQ